MRRRGRLKCWAPGIERTTYATRPDPRPVEPFYPAVVIKREDQQPHGQPVPVTRTAGMLMSAFHQVPAQVL